MNSFLEHKFTNLGTNSENNIEKYCQNESTSIFCPILDFIQSFYMLGSAKHIHKSDPNYSYGLGGQRILKNFQLLEYFFRRLRFSKITGDKPEHWQQADRVQTLLQTLYFIFTNNTPTGLKLSIFPIKAISPVVFSKSMNNQVFIHKFCSYNQC